MYTSFFSALLTAAALLRADQPACQARLELQRHGDNLTVTGHCRNAAAGAARWAYELRTEKQGRSGSASNAQSGRFVAEPGQDVVLSRTTLNLGPHDACRVRLRVLDERGTLLAADSLLLPAAP
ncbi:hypothetical protein EJV47_17390 [Hymenobacter gummosus]|uniref:Curli assembly protein CsgC n=1 Tax=Hymenobacter gummosus TaxID=1776032 RepID=A0A431U0K4_9BACT|nr:curli-like amyloid fiber formation chaperone CsgH [Hymenobacter gummosus]RTQ48203.1 hypothetical protein EJV47_17390 [Hymenobacter gummosus]